VKLDEHGRDEDGRRWVHIDEILSSPRVQAAFRRKELWQQSRRWLTGMVQDMSRWDPGLQRMIRPPPRVTGRGVRTLGHVEMR